MQIYTFVIFVHEGQIMLFLPSLSLQMCLFCLCVSVCVSACVGSERDVEREELGGAD